MVETAGRGPQSLAPRRASAQAIPAWHGHETITSDALLRLLERAARGDSHFSHDQRVFCTACEFWSAVATHSLSAYLRQEPTLCLAAAHMAFERIGAARIASILQQALSHYSLRASSPAARQQWQFLTQTLLSAADPVNQLIAQFASSLPI